MVFGIRKQPVDFVKYICSVSGSILSHKVDNRGRKIVFYPMKNRHRILNETGHHQMPYQNALFISVIILLATAITMEVVEQSISDETWAHWRLNPHIQRASTHGIVSIIATAVHTVVGHIMVGFGIVHLWNNWRAMKSYFRPKTNKIPVLLASSRSSRMILSYMVSFAVGLK